ncbi:MAG TPA: hypothetical protein DIW17_05775, partial [Clostridiales bacterium]|nr:hypothetical protein [Clostridiales bacterium]
MQKELKMKEIFDMIDSLYEEYKQFWIDICNIESFTTDICGVNDVAQHIELFSTEKGFNVRERCFKKAGKCLSIFTVEKSNLPG